MGTASRPDLFTITDISFNLIYNFFLSTLFYVFIYFLFIVRYYYYLLFYWKNQFNFDFTQVNFFLN
jgi:hypothetical protein